MKKNLLFTILAVAMLSGCATQAINGFQAFQPIDLNPQVKSGKLVQKTNSFFVINDSSSSMGKIYLGAAEFRGTKLDVEKDLLNKFNKTIPNIPLNSGLLSFGNGACLDWQSTNLNQPLIKYSPQSFDNAINSLHCSSGGTPLADAVWEAGRDINSASGNIALIILSDGIDDHSPLAAIEALKVHFGEKLCVYPIWVGNEADANGQISLGQLAELAECGFATDAATISNPEGAADFVKKVFFNEAEPVVQKAVKPQAKCPDAPKGAILDKDGCWAFHGVLFDFDKADIKSKFSPAIQNAVEVLKLNPGLTIEIQGHTDSFGTDLYNQKLSERRALAVKRELIKEGIDSKRLTTVGYGETRPVESNETDAGRAYNRRVEYRRTSQ